MMAIVEYKEDDVRLSELETGLSSNAKSLGEEADTTVSKLSLSSSSLSLHALSESCFLKEKHLKGFRKRFQFPKGTVLRLPRPSEKACTFAHGKVCFCRAAFRCDLHFPLHPFIMKLLFHFQIAPSQLVPNTWRTIVSCMSIGCLPVKGT